MFVPGESGNPNGPAPGPRKAFKKAEWHKHVYTLCKQKEFDPFIEMINIATDMSNSARIRLTAANHIAQYMAPKLKSIDLGLGEGLKAILNIDTGRELNNGIPEGN